MMTENEKIIAEEETMQEELLNDEALEDVSGGVQLTGTRVKNLAVKIGAKNIKANKLANGDIQRKPLGARDKDGETDLASVRKGGRIVSC